VSGWLCCSQWFERHSEPSFQGGLVLDEHREGKRGAAPRELGYNKTRYE
jgi:hypothetical protein